MMILGDFFEKPKIELFHGLPDTDFYNRCRKREREIKETIKKALQIFDTHVQTVAKNRNQLSKWKREWMKACMLNLGNYSEDLIKELDRGKIEEYCKIEKFGQKYISFMPDLVLLMINSYHGAVETDLHWVDDLTLSDSIDISIGDFDFNNLEKYLPGRISEIENLIQELKGVQYVNAHFDSIREAINCFKSKHQKASNVLLITVIEGLVRYQGIYLKEKQGLSIDVLDKRKYASLDSFLKKIPWKRDLRISKIRYGLLTGNYSINKVKGDDLVLINLADRLGFLCRRFKENRNLILHGEDANYANSLNSFLNLSALKEVLLTIKEYNGLYA